MVPGSGKSIPIAADFKRFNACSALPEHTNFALRISPAGSEDAKMPIKLYNSKVSPYARKVRLIAAELSLPIEKVELDFLKGDPRKPEYLAMNPNGKVPTIDDDGFVLWESIAILKYLAEKKGKLLPSDARGRAEAD